MMSSYARTIGAILGSAILFPMAFAAFAYPTVVSQGMTILKPGIQPGIVIFAAPDGAVYAVNTQGQVFKKLWGQIILISVATGNA
jgi:hypothetical protein